VRNRERRTSTVTVAPFTIALAVVAGAWLAHTLEYMRVWGWDEFGSATSRQVHTYMGPSGVLLVLLAFIGVEAGLRSFRRFERLFVGLSDGTVTPAHLPATRRRFTLPVTTLLSLVWLLQLVVYMVEENVELRAIGVHQPALSVLTGAHAWAPAVHMVVATFLVLILWLLHRPLEQLAEAVRQIVAWLVAARDPRPAAAVPALRVRSWTPAERFGRQLWSRPPPGAFCL